MAANQFTRGDSAFDPIVLQLAESYVAERYGASITFDRGSLAQTLARFAMYLASTSPTPAPEGWPWLDAKIDEAEKEAAAAQYGYWPTRFCVLKEVRTALAAPPAPEGWRLVPVEPTEEMLRAALWALDRARERDGKIQDPRAYTAREKHAIRWAAMLAASPVPKQEAEPKKFTPCKPDLMRAKAAAIRAAKDTPHDL